MGMLKEFKEFAVKGNLTEMAVAFVMGAAFGKLVTAFIDGMVMPLVGMVVSGVDFKSLKWVITQAGMDAAGKPIAEVAVLYGEFITVCIDFTLIAFFMFMLLKAINNSRKEEAAIPAPPAPPTHEQQLLMEIRDLLKK